MSRMKDEVIKLNVGGTIFKTSRKILCRYRKSLLCELVSDMLKDKSDQSNKEKELFIDRNGNRFEYILDFLRDGILICENNMNLLTKILIEAAYFRLDPLVEIVKKKISSVMSDVDRSINRKMIGLIIKQIDEHGNCWNKKIGALCNDTLMTFCSDLLNNEFIDKQENIIIPQTDVQTLGLLNFSENISQFRKLKFFKLKKKKVHRSNLVHYESNTSKNREDKRNSVNESSPKNCSNHKETHMKGNEHKESSDLEKAYKTGSTDVEDIYHVKISHCDHSENEYYDLNRTPKRDSTNLFLTAPSESESLNKNSTLKPSRIHHDKNRPNSMYERDSYVKNNHNSTVVSADIRGKTINNVPENICEENRRNVYFTNTTGHMNENYINQERMVGNGSSMIPRGNNTIGSFRYVDQPNNKTDNIMTYVDTDDIEETSPFHTTSNVNLGEPVFSTTADF